MGSRPSTKWLTKTDYSLQLADYASKRHPGTLNWLLESVEYRTWLESSPQTLLCSGEPGAGKSVAASFIVQDLTHRLRGDEPDGVSREEQSQQTTTNVAYIFFDSLRQEEQKYDNIALCISAQLASGGLTYREPKTPPWRDVYEWYLRPRPSELSVSRYLKEQIAGHVNHSTVYLVLDALDECPESSRTALLALLAEVQREHGALNVLMTWRKGWTPAPAIQAQFENAAKLEIHAQQQDLEMYMADRLPLDFETLAPTGPDSYDHVYTSIMDKIASQAPHCAHLAERCLSWLTFARRPLSVPELQEALAISIDGIAGLSIEDSPAGVTSVVSSCGGLARMDCINGTSCIRLYDRTTLDYLRQHLSRSEADVGRMCVAYLLSRSDGGACKREKDLTERLRSSPLYNYAARYWGQHIRSISTPLLSDTVIRDFLDHRPRWEGALQAKHTAAVRAENAPTKIPPHGRFSLPYEDVSQQYPRRTAPIHVAACADATNLVAELLAQNDGSAIINARDNDGRTALSYTAEAGNSSILEVLLADSLLDVDARDREGRTPISHAADNGHVSVVSRLLERGANPNWKDLDGLSPLWHAVQYGHVSVVRVLLECGQLSDLNPTPSYYHKNRDAECTPLWHALKNGFDEISEMLSRADGIDAHAGYTENRYDHTTVLGLAIENGHEGIALRLLEKCGIGQSSSFHDLGSELLVAAASIGSTKLVESLLVTHGVDPNTAYPPSRRDGPPSLTPLMAATQRGHGPVVRLLLDTEAIRPDANHDDASALSLAAKMGFRDIVEMLVADGRVVADQKDAEGRTPLSLAAEGAHEEVVEALLINETVDPDCRDNEGRTPLSRAMGTWWISPLDVMRDCHGVVKRLLADARVDPNAGDREGNTPLDYAAKSGDLRLIREFLEHPRTDLGFEHKNALLAVAASEGHADVVKVFLKIGRFEVNALIEYPDKYLYKRLGKTLMSLAAEGGHMGVVDLLLSQPGIEAHKGDIEGRTPLAMAASQGRTAIVERLLAVEGADPNSRDKRGWTPLRMALAERGSFRMRFIGPDVSVVDTIRVLLRAERIDPDAADLEGRTPLSVVCEHADLELVNLFLDSDGVDPDSRDTAGRNPLSWVVAPAYLSVRFDVGQQEQTMRRQDTMRRLLRIQAVDPNAEDAEGLTPLIRAIQDEYGTDLVRVLLERDDLNVHQRSRNGRTPMAFARKMGNVAIMSLLRKRGALDEDNEPPEAIDPSEYRPSDDGLDRGNLRLPRKGKESVDFHAGLERPRSPSSSASSLQPAFTIEIDKEKQITGSETWLTKKKLLPLGAQQEHLDLAEANDADLCAKCNAIDLDEAFSTRENANGVRVIAELGRIDETWRARECPMCRLIAAVSPGRRISAEGQIEEDSDLELVSFSSTGTWLCHSLPGLWRHFTDRWIDTMLLGVVPHSNMRNMPYGEDLDADSALRSGYIGRLGSSCEQETRAITIAQVGGGVDFAAAKGWIACCREEHAQRCNPRTLPRVPNFRLIDCATRRIVQQRDQVPLYVALSYVWGPAGSGEKTKLKHGDSHLPQDGLDLGECVEAVVEDAIRVTLGLGYGFLWVDRYCILQQGDGKVKEEQLQSMDLVYANADVTLVATARQASFSGLPGPSMRLKGHAVTLIPPDPAHQIRSSAWMTRGWTYQEGLLSRRRLFFSESEMSFDCHDLVAREAIRLPPSIERQMYHTFRRLMPLSWTHKPLEAWESYKSDGTDLLDKLTEYTGRKLTYQSDALNAMLGILQAHASLESGPVYHVCGVPILRSRHDEVTSAGFVKSLCWTHQSPGYRRLGFPSWSWAGWHVVVDFPLGRADEFNSVSVLDVEVSIVLADGITPMPWSDSYSQLRSAAARKSRYSSIFSQHHMLDIKANITMVRFWERQEGWEGMVYFGDDVRTGDFALTRKESPPLLGDKAVGFVPTLRRRLLEELWLGIVMGCTERTAYVLVVEEMPPSATDAIPHWERVGLLTIHNWDWRLASGMLERRKLRLA
ncbi:hypothetical protein Neosp_006825 [[Neocosmospora] mangrovei]